MIIKNGENVYIMSGIVPFVTRTIWKQRSGGILISSCENATSDDSARCVIMYDNVFYIVVYFEENTSLRTMEINRATIIARNYESELKKIRIEFLNFAE